MTRTFKGCACPLTPEAVKKSMVGTRCCASATVNPTRTRGTASLPDQVHAANGIFSQFPSPALGRGEPILATVAVSDKARRSVTMICNAQLMKRKLPVLALLLALGLTAEDRVQTKPGSGGSSASGRIIRSGATHFERLCAGCHGSDGLALEGEAPPLAGSSWVAGPETRLIRIVMHGVRGPIQVGDKIYDREMPGVGRRLSDREMASMLSFVRSRWGASSAPITPEAVRRVRTAAGNRTRYWIAEELLAAP